MPITEENVIDELRAHNQEALSFLIQQFVTAVSTLAGRINSTTGAIEWVQVGIHPGQSSLTLHLTDPEVYIRGPWVFHIHMPASGRLPSGTDR